MEVEVAQKRTPEQIADQVVAAVFQQSNPPVVKLTSAVAQAIRDAYERAAKAAESAEYNGAEIRELDNGDEYYAEAGHEQARRDIAAAIRALKGAV